MLASTEFCVGPGGTSAARAWTVVRANERQTLARALGRVAGGWHGACWGHTREEARAGSPVPGRSMRDTETVTVELDIPSSIGMLETADVLVEHVAATAGFDPDSSQAIQVALHEALVNAIVHGNDEEETRRVNVELAARADGLAVRVRDEGRGFDPSRVPDPLAPESLCKPSGRGIFLSRRLTCGSASGTRSVSNKNRIAPRP